MKYKLNIFKSISFHLKRSFFSPLPLRVNLIQIFMKKFKLGTFKQRLDYDAVEYPGYAYGMFSAALQAKSLGLKKITALEFGVASGNGLISIENHAREIYDLLGIEFDIYGFDTGIGLPKPKNYKDQGYFWDKSFFPMNQEKLEKNLNISKLIIGDIKNTINSFIKNNLKFPIGFVAFDLDYYSSTKTSFEIFNVNDNLVLPRVECYMDDVASTELLVASKGTGVLRAIEEFNIDRKKEERIFKKELVYQFRIIPSFWNEKLYVFHRFDHSKYNHSVKNY